LQKYFSMKYYIVAGEASGDLHASNLMKELKKIDKNAIFRGFGGNLMQEEGIILTKHYKDLAFMGLFEVLRNIRTILKNFSICKRDILDFQPDAVILVDYPGFNLRMAKFAKLNNFNVFYYISPKIWVWKSSRAKIIKQFVDKMFVIFPFEKDFYRKFDYEVEYVGNPLWDALQEEISENVDFQGFTKEFSLENKPIIALLPGSRRQEIKLLLPEMIKVVSQYNDFQFVIAASQSIERSFYEKFIETSKVYLVYNQTYKLLKHATAALVTSGTATLETALFEVPQAVCYKMSTATFRIGKLIIDVKFFSLPNIIMNQEIVKEFLQFDLAEKMKNELDKILFDVHYRKEMLKNYKILKEKLGESGASQKTAEKIYSKIVY